jgi:hypothetical protein
MPVPHADPQTPAHRAAREMAGMQLEQAQELLTQAGLLGSPELLGQMVLALATNYQTLMLKR